ncbi:hypothetical protein ACFYRL_17645 [Streptomyces goshikiensis]|uniref:hypothetical protein n=1 Tax=Streptomyces goshikiensis TaxID=1942 RepID=UPI003682E0C4
MNPTRKQTANRYTVAILLTMTGGVVLIAAVTVSSLPLAVVAAVAFLATAWLLLVPAADTRRTARAARTVRLLAYHRARAANHPSAAARRRSDRALWRLAKRLPVHVDDTLVQAYRAQMTQDAAAVDAMFAPRPADPERAGTDPQGENK